MHFTQEDYKKIESWLLRNSVKDTEFQEALPLTGDESVVITQDNHNRNLKIKDFVDEIIKVGIADFLNVTERYKSPNITLKEAIALVPDLLRKKGQVITFSNPDGNWEIYQFTGALNQWNNVTLWEDVFNIDKFIINSILPDEEDLTKSEVDKSGNSFLSLKDREYNPTEFSGLGRVILRKNLVEFEDGKGGKVIKNYLSQKDFSKENTIYEIRYDFDLNNQTIYIPTGCQFDYVGGSLSNGKVVYNNTLISGNEIIKSITREGNYNYLNSIADNEDLVSVDGKLSLKDRSALNGMGYVILRKNKTFAEQVKNGNTIYEIRYDSDLGGKDVTIPQNSILRFNGGHLSNGNLIFNDLPQIEGDGLRCTISGKVCRVKGEWFGLGRESAAYHHTILQDLVSKGYAIDFAANTIIEVSEQISVASNLRLSCDSIVKREDFPKLIFPNGDGFVWNAASYSADNLVETISIESKGYCLNFSNGQNKNVRPHNVYMSTFRNLSLNSLEKDCIYAHDNRGIDNDLMCFQNLFDDIYLTAPKGCGINGVNGLNNFFTNITDVNISQSLFHNVYGVIRDCNTSFSATKHFLSYDSALYTNYDIRLEIVNCNMERYTGEVIYYSDDMADLYAFYVRLNNVSIIYNAIPELGFTDNPLPFYPIMFKGLMAIEIKRLSFLCTSGGLASDKRLIKWTPVATQDISVSTDKTYQTHCVPSPSVVIDYLFETIGTTSYNLFADDWLNKGARSMRRLIVSDYIKHGKSLLAPQRIDVTSYNGDYGKQLIINKSDYIELYATANTRLVNLGTAILSDLPNYVEEVILQNVSNYQIQIETTNFAGAGERRVFSKNGVDITLAPGDAVVLSIKTELNGHYSIKEVRRITNKMEAGASDVRPTLTNYDIGFQYYDTTLRKPIWYAGDGVWNDATGASV